MKTKYLFLAALTSIALVSCMSDELVGDNTSPQTLAENDGAIMFNYNLPNMTRAGEFVGATAAGKLGGMFVVEGTKGSEQTNSPSTTVVFDNYLVGYEANTAGKTESNTHNWEYVGKQTGITDRMTDATWTALHGSGTAQSQTIKYWDYSQDQYDFIAWSTGNREAITTAAENGKVKVTRINTGTTLSSKTAGQGGFTMSAFDADDLLECYYTDITTVTKASGNYGKPVTLTFRNMAAKVRVALYETVPGYSVKEVMFYPEDAPNPAIPNDLGSNTGLTAEATLFTTSATLPKSGDVLVYYPFIGSDKRGNNTFKKVYNKASVTVTGGTLETTQTFGTLAAQYRGPQASEATGNHYLGRKLTEATYAGDATKDYYTAVIPNDNNQPLTLRIDYTLVSTDGSGESIKVYGAKAVVPATYTEWQPNYAYTYIFKISDNTNGWTATVDPEHDPAGLFPITFDAVVTSFTDVNAEQTTVTTVATPSITTYQQGHNHANKDEYSRQQKAGVDVTNVKDVYVQVMNNSTSPATLVTGLTADNSLLYKLSKENASEAEVLDALQNRSNTYAETNPVGRNGITLTKDASHILNTVESIVNGVDDQPITVSSGTAAKIDIDALDVASYAYVYASTVPDSEDKIYNVVNASASDYSYYEVHLTGTETPLSSGTATAGKVYFVKNVDANGDFVSYTFKQTKIGESVVGLVEATPSSSLASSYTAGNFYFSVYNKNNGVYAVKVIKVVD